MEIDSKSFLPNGPVPPVLDDPVKAETLHGVGPVAEGESRLSETNPCPSCYDLNERLPIAMRRFDPGD